MNNISLIYLVVNNVCKNIFQESDNISNLAGKAEWYFLTNHSLVLGLINRNQKITGIELSRAIGITERAVRRIIADLDAAGYISKEKNGRCTIYRINQESSMRHELIKETGIGDLLSALSWKLEEDTIHQSEDYQAKPDR